MVCLAVKTYNTYGSIKFIAKEDNMKHRKLLAAAIATPALLTASNAFAHDGDHSGYILSNVIHWLSSPTHSLFAVIGGVIASAMIVKLVRKSRA